MGNVLALMGRGLHQDLRQHLLQRGAGCAQERSGCTRAQVQFALGTGSKCPCIARVRLAQFVPEVVREVGRGGGVLILGASQQTRYRLLNLSLISLVPR